MIEELIDYLESEGIGEKNVDMFIGELPFDKSEIISFAISPSPEPNKSIAYFTQTVDVWARFASFDDGVAKLQSVFDLLHGKANYDISGAHIYLSYAMGMIDDLGRDAERRHLFKLTFSITYRKGVLFS